MAEALSVPHAVSDDRHRGGIPAVRSTIRLAVPEMHCGGCMRKVEQALTSLPGVDVARANLSSKRVAIVTSGRRADAEAFIEALRSAGFSATVLADDGISKSSQDGDNLLRRLGVAGFAAANVMLLSVSVWSGYSGDMPTSVQTLFHWLSALIAIPAIGYAGQPFFASARSALASRRLNMDVPISLGVTLATVMSVYQTARGSEQVYFDAAITLLFFLLIGRVLDERVRRRAASAAENLLGLRAPTTSVVNAVGSIHCIATAEVRPGDRILVAAGDRIPVDARLVKGTTEIDESLISGESRPRIVTTGDRLYCGSINLSGPIEAEATAVADNTLLAEISRLLATAEQARGRYVRLADRAARIYAPAVHILGAATFAGWMLAGHGWEAALTAAIAVLIITCPCALALAVPTVQVVAAGRLFRSGMILKAADGLERLSEIDTIVLDKTGTLTSAEPQLVDQDNFAPSTLARAAALASRSRHPYARAVVRAAGEKGIAMPNISSSQEIVGTGLIGKIGETEVRLGSGNHVGLGNEDRQASSLWFRDGNEAPIEMQMAERLRPDAVATVKVLVAEGYGIEVLSGDRAEPVRDASLRVGIDNWRSDQRPDEKLKRLEALKSAGHKVLMVGDGLNDAPALAAGHASISPANAADISQTAADAVLQGEALQPIIVALEVAKAAQRRAIESFAIAIGYNALFVPLAVVGLVTPLVAAVAMSASSIAVTLNALRLLRGSLGAPR